VNLKGEHRHGNPQDPPQPHREESKGASEARSEPKASGVDCHQPKNRSVLEPARSEAKPSGVDCHQPKDRSVLEPARSEPKASGVDCHQPKNRSVLEPARSEAKPSGDGCQQPKDRSALEPARSDAPRGEPSREPSGVADRRSVLEPVDDPRGLAARDRDGDASVPRVSRLPLGRGREQPLERRRIPRERLGA
jgi:hypothetical protein